jgi:hypothetical protein
MKKIIKHLLSIALIASIGGTMLAVSAPQTVSAADDSCNRGFLGFPSWYRGLTNDTDCSLKSPADVGGLQKWIITVAINVVEIGVILSAYVAAVFLIYGGFLFVTSGGSPDGASKLVKPYSMLLSINHRLVAVAIVKLIASIWV